MVKVKQGKVRKISKSQKPKWTIKAKQGKANASQGKAVGVGQSKGKACRVF